MKIVIFRTLIILTLSARGNAARTATAEPFTETVAVAALNSATETPTATTTPVPTETPIPPPSFDVTKPYGEWDLSAFSAEDQAKIIQAMNDPDHTPRDVKDFVDGLLLEGIRELTGDPNVTIGKYIEFLFANGIHEVSPLPFEWRKNSLGNLDNFPVWNDKGRPEYLMEGYEGLGHDPMFNIDDATHELWSSVEWESLRTGVGKNKSPNTPELQALFHQDRIDIGHNQDRDLIFGEPFLITYPMSANTNGDLMVLTQIAGVNPEVAQEAIIRVYGYDALPRYIIMRIQYQQEVIQEGDTSCMIIPRPTSEFCAPGRVLNPAVVYSWDDPRREISILTTRSKMLELMSMPGFIFPLRLTLQGGLHRDRGTYHNDLFMDGAVVVGDIKIPTVPTEFFE